MTSLGTRPTTLGISPDRARRFFSEGQKYRLTVGASDYTVERDATFRYFTHGYSNE